MERIIRNEEHAAYIGGCAADDTMVMGYFTYAYEHQTQKPHYRNTIKRVAGKKPELVRQKLVDPKNSPKKISRGALGVRFYCNHCHKMSINPSYVITRDLYDSFEAVICPHCGTEIRANQIMFLKYEWTRRIRGIGVFDNVMGDYSKVAVNANYWSLFPGKTKLGVRYEIERIVFNLKTGQTYKVPRKINGQKVKGPAVQTITINAINSSPFSEYITLDQLPGLEDLIINGVAQYRGVKFSKRPITPTLADLVIFNRFPCDDPQVVVTSLRRGYEGIKKAFLKIKPNREFISSLLADWHVRGKATRKIVALRPDKVFSYATLSEIIKSPELLAKMLDHPVVGLFGLYPERETEHFNVKFLRLLVGRFGEPTAIRKITDNNSDWLFSDTARMYFDLPEEYRPVLRGSIREMHDEIYPIRDKVRKQLRHFKLTDLELSLEDEINGYLFKVARTNHELIDIGSKMHHCVGGYDSLMDRKDCTIVTMTKDGQYQVCFELRISGKTIKVKQAKAKYNAYPAGEVYDTAIAWAKRHNMDYSSSYDLLQQNAQELVADFAF